MRTTIKIVLLALVAPLVAVVASGPADAVYTKYAHDGLHNVGLTGFDSLVVDTAAGRVFVSDGSTVIVTDLDGALVQTLTLGAPASSMAVSSDGGSVFASDSASGALARIDATTLAVTTGSLGVGACGGDVAATAGLVWVLNLCPTDSQTVVAVDPDTLAVVDSFAVDPTVDHLTADDAAVPNALFAWGDDASTHTIQRLDVTGGATPTLTPGATQTSSLPVTIVRVEPSGSGVLAGDTASGFERYDAGTLAKVKYFSAGSDLTSISEGSDGTIAFASSHDMKVGFYFPGGDSVDSAVLPGLDDYVADGGSVLGGGRIYSVAVITRSDGSQVYRLWIVTPAKHTGVQVTTSKNVYRYGASVSVKGQLTWPTTYSGQTLEIYVKPVGGTKRLLASGPVDSNGVFTARFTLKKRTNLYVEFPGDETYAPSSDRRLVRVTPKMVLKMTRTKKHDGKYALYNYSKYAVARLHVLPNLKGECVSFAWYYYRKGWQFGSRVKCVHLNRHSRATLRLQGDQRIVGMRFRVIASYSGGKVAEYGSSRYAYFRFVN